MSSLVSRRRSHSIVCSVIAAAVLGLPAVLSAQVFEWTGVSGGVGWSNPGNWNPGVPTSSATTVVAFNNAAVPTMTMDLAGGLTLNRLEFGTQSVPRTLSGTQLLNFAGTNPSIDYRHAAGAAGNIVVGVPVQLQETLTLTGSVDFTRQFAFNSASSLRGTGGLVVESGLYATNSVNNTFTGPVTLGGDVVVQAFGTTATTLLFSGSLELRGFNLTASPSAGHLVATTGVVSGLGEVRVNAVATAQGLYLAGTTPNTFIGTIRANVGTLFIARENQLGDPDNDLVLSNGGALATAGTLPSGSVVTLPASRSITLSAGGRLGSNGSEQLRVEGVISGSGPLQIMAGGRGVVLAGANIFTGNVEVSESGRLTILGDAALGVSGNQLVILGTTLGSEVTLPGSGVVLPASRTIRIDAGRWAGIGATGTDATIAGNIIGGGVMSTFGLGSCA